MNLKTNRQQMYWVISSTRRQMMTLPQQGIDKVFVTRSKGQLSTLLIVLVGSFLVYQDVAVNAFQAITRKPIWPYSTSHLMAKNRKARRMQQVERSRPKQFFDIIEDAQSKKKDTITTGGPPDEDGIKDESAISAASKESVAEDSDAGREARAKAARERMEQRPVVSTMIVDEETGIEVVAQGKSVMDVISRKAVQLSPLGPAYRLAQMFPGVPPDVFAIHRVDWNTVEVAELVERLRNAAMVTLADGTRNIPPHPSVSNDAIDFVLANRPFLGSRMKRTLGRLAMRSASLGDREEAQRYNRLWKNFLTIENHISAPFRQMIMDAEGRVGPRFGNLDVMSYCNGPLYERIANYLVLKGMVAHWEKKVVDADYVERTPITKENYITVLSRGDPKRYLPDPPILFTLKECTQVCAMAQKMTAEFVKNPELFDDFPPEVRFLEQALSIKGGTAMRKYMIDEFCPAEKITPSALREGMRRLMVQLENMQIDPYADITNIIERLVNAMAVGSEDERDPYVSYLVNVNDPDSPGAFQSYTMNYEKLSLVRFLDSQYESAGSSSPIISPLGAGGSNSNQNGGGGFLGGLFNSMKQPQQQPISSSLVSNSESDYTYNTPKERAAGRPHNLGWLDLLKDEENKNNPNMRLGKVPAGKIIVEKRTQE